MSSPLCVDGERLWQHLETLARIGATAAGGVTRLALSEEDRCARDLFVHWAGELGCQVRIDAMGNLFARREGRQPHLAPVLTGSHLDSQPAGGKYDGAYGVVAGLEVLRTLDDHGLVTERAIEVVSWTNEEGARFAPPMLASGVYAGVFDLAFGLDRRDAEGISLGAALEAIGYAGSDPKDGRAIHAAFELHIEQGPILEAQGLDIGVVTGAQGQRWYEVELRGRSAHAGTTPLHLRRDCALGLARIIEAVQALGEAQGEEGRATVGWVTLAPNSRNVVAGQARFSVEFRHPSATVLEALDLQLAHRVAAIAAELHLEYHLQSVFRCEPLAFDAACVETVAQAAETLGYAHRRMLSGAGHDACYLNRVAPTAMIFVPCVDGLSHNEAEHIHPHWARAGADVLLHAVLAKANDPGEATPPE